MSTQQHTAEFFGEAVTIIDHNGKRWLTACQVGRCLGYNEANERLGVMKLYDRHRDRFDEGDTCVVNLTTQGQSRATRIFSLTGCVTLGWLSNTKRAAEFQRWAKNNLAAQIDGEKVALTFDEVNTLIDCAKGGDIGRDARKCAVEILNRFGRGASVPAPADASPRLEASMAQMAQHVGTMAQNVGAIAGHMGTLAGGMKTVLTQMNMTSRYIGLLEIHQTGKRQVTPAIREQVKAMALEGLPYADIGRLLRISRTTVSLIARGHYPETKVCNPPTVSVSEQIDEWIGREQQRLAGEIAQLAQIEESAQ